MNDKPGQVAITQEQCTVSGAAGVLDGFFAYPKHPSGPLPGILVVHEIFGLTNHIRDITSRLAEAGYAALAVDLFTNRNRAICISRLMLATIRGQIDHFGVRDLEAALGDLARHPLIDRSRIGAIGFCMGGGFAIAMACRDRNGAGILKAIAPFYAFNPRPVDQVRGICPVVGSYPEHDFTAKGALRLQFELSESGVAHDIKLYDKAKHGFMDRLNPKRYAQEPAEDAWRRTLDFFGEQLGVGSPTIP